MSIPQNKTIWGFNGMYRFPDGYERGHVEITSIHGSSKWAVQLGQCKAIHSNGVVRREIHTLIYNYANEEAARTAFNEYLMAAVILFPESHTWCCTNG